MLVEAEKTSLLPMRRTQRIFARVPLNVSGRNQDHTAFEEKTFTIAVNADGGLLRLRKAVRKGQRLSLVQELTGQQEFCVVAHVELSEDGFNSVRVQFLEAHPEFWHVSFPPEDWTPRHADSKFNHRPESRNAVAARCVALGNC
jgi:hypothetical protein